MDPMRFDVIGLGICTLDLLHLVDELPGEEWVQRAHESVLQGGGPVATALVALARLGSRTAMLDAVGDDWRGKLIIEELEKEGVSTAHMTACPGRSSSMASILVRKRDGARTIVYAPGDAEALTLSGQDKALIAAAKILHLNGRHLRACIAAATLARDRGVTVSFDGGAHRYHDELRDLVKLTDLCIVARQFACAFSGVEDVEASARSFFQAGAKIVVITAGVEGSWIFEKNGVKFHQPASPVGSVVDTTGAGDAFHGAFLHGMVNNHGLPACAALASAVAAMNTRRLGGRTTLPSYEEADRYRNLARPEQANAPHP